MVFCDYENQVNAITADQRSIILCTYPLTTSPADQVFDIAHIHHVAVARRNGTWEIIETPELKKAKAEIKRLNDELEEEVEERTRELARTNEALRAEIAERKLAEEALRRAEDRIRLVIDTIPTMAWSLRPDGVLDFLNQRWLDYTGLSLQEAIEEPTRTVHPEDLPRVTEKWLMVKNTDEAYEDEMRLRRADGVYRWFLIRIAPLLDEQGNLLKRYGVSIDIEDRKQAEEALRGSETRFRQLAENISQVFWLANPEATLIHYVSPAYEKMWGRSCDSLYAEPMSWMDSIHLDDRKRIADEEQLQLVSGQHDHTYRIIRPDGSVRWIRDRAFPVRDEAGKLIRVAGIAEDVTERKEAEEQREEYTRLLQTLSRRLFEVQEKERRHLARELHDEIGQALTAAKINLQSVAANGDSANVPRLHETSAILDRLLGQVRQISLDLRPSMLDDLGLVPALRSLIDQQGRRASVEMRFSPENLPESLDAKIQTTCFRIAQEAITNALRHAHATHVDVDLRREEENLRLVIRDNGSGFDAESAQAQSAGLGLIGIKERAALLGGGARIISSPNKGTTIEVSLPLTPRTERAGRHRRK
jgi:PAS domain S-box-containing protein